MKKQKSFADQVVSEARRRRTSTQNGKAAYIKTGPRLTKLFNKERKQ